MELFVETGFESAHFLPQVPDGHKCRRVHGHSFRVVVTVAGEPDPVVGWVMDFADLKAAVRPVIDELDHQLLNDLDGLENPTSEVLAVWIWARLTAGLPGLLAVEVRETCTAGCRYLGPGG